MKKRKPGPRLRDDALDRIGNDELREALLDKLTVAELNELTRQIEVAVQKSAWEAAARATEEAYRRHIACTFRVLRDNFGFGRKRLHRLFDRYQGYTRDIDEGIISVDDMLRCLRNQDKIDIDWKVIL